MSPWIARWGARGSRFPRASGDEPALFDLECEVEQFSPRERG